MAWVDDRLWCHPKFADISDKAFRAYVNGVAYSSGFACLGHLTEGQQKTIGVTPAIRRELITAGLWDTNGDGAAILIHDWEVHNGKRDARKAADRERKKRARRDPSDEDIPF